MTPPLIIANTGITKANRVMDAPIKLPAKIEGVRSIIAEIPIESSGIDVSIPKIKNLRNV